MFSPTQISLAAIAAVALTPAAASARHGGGDNGVRVAGSCGSGATSKLKLKNDDGVIEVEFEVDQNRAGKRWRLTLVRDGNVVYRGHRTTTAPSGSFSLERRIRNLAGADRITARGVGPGGVTCTAAATLSA
jgi:hypothetical protein